MDRELDEIVGGQFRADGNGPRSLYELAGKICYKTRFYEAFKEILPMMHDKLLKECMREISEERGEDMPWKPILYCGSHGGFGFSDSFLTFIDCSEFCRRDRKWSQDDDSDRHVYDSVAAFGNLILNKAPDMIAECDKVNEGLDRQSWEKDYDARQPPEPEKRDKGAMHFLDAMDARTAARIEKDVQFREAQQAYQQQFQSRLITTIQTEQNLQQWYCPRPASKNVEEAGFKLASTKYCSLAVKWVPPLASYCIGEYDGLESVDWWFRQKQSKFLFQFRCSMKANNLLGPLQISDSVRVAVLLIMDRGKLLLYYTSCSSIDVGLYLSAPQRRKAKYMQVRICSQSSKCCIIARLGHMFRLYETSCPFCQQTPQTHQVNRERIFFRLIYLLRAIKACWESLFLTFAR